MVLSQFPQIILRTPKPNIPLITREFNTIGNHILHRRTDLGLLQKDIATLFNVSRETIINWETRPSLPRVQLMPRIVDFLGYTPYHIPKSHGQWLAQCR